MYALIIVRAFIYSLVIALLALAVSRLNLFDLSNQTDRLSDHIIQQIMAPNYGQPNKHDKPDKDGHVPVRGQDDISLIYLDDSQVAELHRTMDIQAWPPSFSDYAGIVRRLTTSFSGNGPAYKPQAIFLDFTFNGPLADTSEKSRRACLGNSEDAIPGKESDPPALYETPECSHWKLAHEIWLATKAKVWSTGIGKDCYGNVLLEIACIVDAGGTPVILGRPAFQVTEDFSQQGRSNFQRELSLRTVFAEISVSPETYPLITPKRHIENFDKHEMEIVRQQQYDLSPAAALYAVHCLQPGNDGCGIEEFRAAGQMAHCLLQGGNCQIAQTHKGLPKTQSSKNPGEAWPESFTEALSPTWGVRPAYRQEEITQRQNGYDDCQMAGGQLSGSEFISRAIDVIFGFQRRHDCFYALHQSYYALGGFLSPDQEKYLLDNKLVVVGSNFKFGPDWVDTPVNGSVPGVVLHAMALDNLLHYGERYRRVASEPISSSNLLEAILLFSILFLNRMAIIGCHRLHTVKPRRRMLAYLIGLYLGVLFLSIAISTVIVSLGLTVLRAEPINWLGVIDTAIVIGLIEMHEPMKKDLGALISKTAVLRECMAFVCAARDWADVEKHLHKTSNLPVERPSSEFLKAPAKESSQ